MVFVGTFEKGRMEQSEMPKEWRRERERERKRERERERKGGEN